MKEIRLKIIIAVMSVSLIGLSVLQLYLINNAMEMERERFKKDITDVLTNTVRQIAKIETTDYILKLTNENGKDTLITNPNGNTPNSLLFISIDSGLVSPDQNIPQGKDFNFNPVDSIMPETGEVSIIKLTGSDSSSVKQKRKLMRKFIMEKDKIVKEIINEYVYYTVNKPIKERLNQELISSILHNELAVKGYDSEFIYNVESEDNLVFETNNGLKNELLSSEYKSELFPDELSQNKSYLLLCIPDEDSYLFQSVMWIFLLSVFFIITVVIIFYKTVSLFLTQKKLTEIKDDLINNITHEFKTPLSTITIAVENLLDPSHINNRQSLKQYSEIIIEENKRLQIMIDTLLDTAANEKRGISLAKTNCDLNKLISGLVEKYNFLFSETGARINCNIPASSVVIALDEFHTANMLSNIIENSIKYNDKSPVVDISYSSQNEQLVITIADNGLGIEKKYLKKIFDTFYRVPTGNIHNVKGYGVGLSYVKQVADAHGWEIKVTSKLGEGTVFTINIPVG